MSRSSFFLAVFALTFLTIPVFANSPGTPAVGWVSFAGSEQCTSTDTGLDCDPGYALVQVYGYTVTYNYVAGDTPQSVSVALAAAFNNPSSPVTATAANGYLTITSKTRGSSANSQLTAIYSGDISTGTIGMIGGRDGARNFRMAMYFDPDTTYSDVTFGGLPISQPGPTPSPFDPAQASTAPQPIAHSILALGPWAASNFSSAWQSFIQQNHYDFSRIDAINIDEPYWDLLGGLGLRRDGDPCNPSDSRYTIMKQGFADLQTVAQLIRQASPTTRFWVNFSRPELNWMMQGSCAWLNASYIDVVSLDYYGVHFFGTNTSSAVQPYYNWLIAHPSYPGQQLALVPGTSVFLNEGAVTQGEFLEEFFNYAAVMNQSCNLPPSSVGTTGIFDGCPIWLVSGFEFDNCCEGFVGLADPSTAPIRAEWLAELSNPRSAPGSVVSLSPTGQLPATYFQNQGQEMWVSWCFTGGCTWDDPTGDARAPLASPGSPLTAVSAPSGPLLHYLDANNHVIHLWARNGFSDTWQDETTASGIGPAGAGSSLATVLAPDGTPFTYFLGSNEWVTVIWCSGSSCIWDGPGGDAQAPSAATGSPLTAVWTSNGPLVHYLAPNGHVIGLWAGHGFSDTWTDETTASGIGPAVTGSSLATVLAPDGTPFTYFLDSNGWVDVIWCSGSSCIWDSPGGDAQAPRAAPGSPMTALWTSNGPLLHYFTTDSHLISLWAGHGFSDTWQDETASAGTIPAIAQSSLSTVSLSNTVIQGGGWISHFTVPGGPVYSITCTSSTTPPTCTAADETAAANALPSAVF